MKNYITMKYARCLTVIAMLTGALTLGAATVEIEFQNPENYSDMEDNGFYSERLFERFSENFTAFVKKEAGKYLPEGATLSMTVKDVDLAGEFEYWRGPDFNDVRIIKEIYPPRLKFDFKVTGPDDKVVKEGMAQITDLTYLWNLSNPARRYETFYYEQELIEDWLRRELDDLSFGEN